MESCKMMEGLSHWAARGLLEDMLGMTNLARWNVVHSPKVPFQLCSSCNTESRPGSSIFNASELCPFPS
jgi:hypothetical protein